MQGLFFVICFAMSMASVVCARGMTLPSNILVQEPPALFAEAFPQPAYFQHPVRTLGIHSLVQFSLVTLPRYKEQRTYQNGKWVDIFEPDWKSYIPYCTIINKDFFFDPNIQNALVDTVAKFRVISIKGTYDDLGIPTVINHSYFNTRVLLESAANQGLLELDCGSYYDGNFAEIKIGDFSQVFGDKFRLLNVRWQNPGSIVEDPSDADFVLQVRHLKAAALQLHVPLTLKKEGQQSAAVLLQEGRVVEYNRVDRTKPYCEFSFVPTTATLAADFVLSPEQEFSFYLVEAGYAKSADPNLYFGRKGFLFGGMLRQGNFLDGDLRFVCNTISAAVYPRKSVLEEVLGNLVTLELSTSPQETQFTH